jgi:sugar/nucleoside kinase (ribokinase family)
MQPKFVIAGMLNREYILPPSSPPLIDTPGGNLLYAAGGLAVWDSHAGLIARVSENYPRQWIRDLERYGLDARGIQIIAGVENIDPRRFIAFTETLERSTTNAVSHFARRQLNFPKSLLGYQTAEDTRKNPREIHPISPSVRDVPKDYRNAAYVHLCPFDFTSQSQMVNLFKGGATQIISLDPALEYMTPALWRELRIALQGVDIFSPSEEELRTLFWGETNDLWEMARRVSEYGPRVVIIKRGKSGQLLYDVTASRRYEIPAYPSRVVDPTGAGDAFCGGFLAGYEKTNDPLIAALHGNISASLKVEGSGPFYPLDVMPGLAEARVFALKEMVREI